jgi:hypothetical protein
MLHIINGLTEVLPFWIESAAYKTSLAQSFFIEVPVANPVEWAVKHNSVQPSLQ